MTDEEPVCIIQWGKHAFREGEPAIWTGQVMQQNPKKGGPKGFFAVVAYADTGPFYVNMNLPRYAHGEKPPLLSTRNVYDKVRDEKGAMVDDVDNPRYERPEHRQHWLEFIPMAKCRKALKVKE
jgi:hypothetical protein